MRIFRIRTLIISLAIAGPASGDAVAAGLPKDPCALLKPNEIQTLAPNASIRSGVQTNNAPLGSSCAYRWGSRTGEWGETSLTVTVVDTAKTWPGGFDVKQRIVSDVRAGGPESTEIAGIGDGAAFTTNPGSYNATAKAYLVKAKGVLVELTFHGGSAAVQKDRLIKLLKAVVAAL